MTVQAAVENGKRGRLMEKVGVAVKTVMENIKVVPLYMLQQIYWNG